MSQFERSCIAPKEIQPERLEKDATDLLNHHPQYAPYSSIDTSVSDFEAETTLAGLDRVLGSRITRLLLQTDAEHTVKIGAQILSTHSRSHGSKDLQVNLLVNIVKEIAQYEEDSPQGIERFGEDLLRRCTLDNGMKVKVIQTLFENSAIHVSKLVQTSM